MNQILQVKGKEKNNKTRDIKTVILFLTIVIVVFGFTYGGYLIFQSIINGTFIPSLSTQTPEYVPTIELIQTKDKLEMNIESEIGISNITYNWNSESPQTIELHGKNIIQKILDIPTGENTIYISIIDVNGKETKKQQTFVLEEQKPLIELSVVGNNIKITVTSETELEEISYKWNSETEKTENMLTYENKMQFEKKLEIPIGQNTLQVIAKDVNGKETTKIQEIKGITKATTTTEVKGEYWHFTVTAKEDIKTVQFEFNGKKYIMNANTFGQTKTVHYKVKLVEGKNYLNITSTTESDGVDTTTWEQEYKAK